MLTRLGRAVRALDERHLHTNVIGLARTCIALGTLATLIFSRPTDVFAPAVGLLTPPRCGGVTDAGLFCLAGSEHLDLAWWLAIAALTLVASGWRPRVTGLLHWYVTASFFSSGTLVDGGDQAATVLTFLLVPVTLTDPRPWHWSSPRRSPSSGRVGRLFALTCLWAIRVQVAAIYLQAGVSKMKVDEWRDGTAVYYWFTDPWFGIPEPVLSWVMPLLTNAAIVTSITWGAMLLELFLFAGLVATRRTRAMLLAAGVAFHGAIAVIHGLASFVIVMWGALILFLRPWDHEIGWLRVAASRAVALLSRRAGWRGSEAPGRRLAPTGAQERGA